MQTSQNRYVGPHNKANQTVLKLNLKSSPHDSMTGVDEWLSNQMQKQITELFPDGSITIDTRLVMAYALY